MTCDIDFNTTDYTDEESDSAHLTRRILEVYIGPGICVFGFLGNLLAIIVLRRLHSKATVCLLTALAAVDSLYLATQFVLYFVHHISCVNMDLIWSALLHSRMSSVWLVVSITVERYIVVCYPLRVHSVCTVGNAKRLILIILLICTAYASFDYIYCSVKGFNETVHDTISNTYSTMYFLIYRSILDPLFHFLVPFNVLFILNIKLIKSISSAQQEHCLLSHKSSSQSNRLGTPVSHAVPKTSTTLNIVGVVSVFLLTQPIVCVNNMWQLDHQYWGHILFSEHSDYIFDNVVRPIAICSLGIPSAVNFIIYSLFYRKFRDVITMRRSCCKLLKCTSSSTERASSDGMIKLEPL